MIGLTVTVGSFVSLPFLIFAERIVDFWGHSNLLIVCFASYIIHFTCKLSRNISHRNQKFRFLCFRSNVHRKPNTPRHLRSPGSLHPAFDVGYSRLVHATSCTKKIYSLWTSVTSYYTFLSWPVIRLASRRNWIHWQERRLHQCPLLVCSGSCCYWHLIFFGFPLLSQTILCCAYTATAKTCSLCCAK